MKKFPLIFSRRMRDVLLKIDHQIAKDLLSLHGGSEVSFNQAFIDIDPTESSFITFIQCNKAAEILGLDDEKILSEGVIKKISSSNIRSKVYNLQRSKFKWGRFLNSNFEGKYQQSGAADRSDIETFVNKYKSVVDRDVSAELFDIINGSDIAKYYNWRKYARPDSGSLGNSCMRSVDSSYFDIYAKNPEKVSMVILRDKDDNKQIIGRAIVWSLDSHPGITFMDRIYVSNYADEQKFKDFAHTNKWLYKSDQAIGSEISLVNLDGSRKQYDIWTKLNPIHHDRYPYCDTMRYYNHESGVVSNCEKFNPMLLLGSTGGDYETLRYVFSKHLGMSISANNARYCIFGDDYVYSSDAIRVWNGDGGYAVPGFEGVVKSDIKVQGGDIVSKYFPKEKCTWSDYLNTWVFTDSSVMVWTDSTKTVQVLENVKRKDFKFIEIDGEFYVSEVELTGGEPKKKRKSKKSSGETPADEIIVQRSGMSPDEYRRHFIESIASERNVGEMSLQDIIED